MIQSETKATDNPVVRPVLLFRACYGKWESWNSFDESHAQWDDHEQIFAADDALDAKWIAYTDPIQLKGYQLQMIEELVPVPLGAMTELDEF